MTHKGLPQAIRAEATMTDITITAMARRMKICEQTASQVVRDLVAAGMIEAESHARNNQQYYRVTDDGYRVSGVRRPELMA